ncbi:nuclease-related domain-containing protein [Nitrospinaceae bacterium]|nr:nuclease-related domain-containing protein [Nitrospinaceae bacterium]
MVENYLAAYGVKIFASLIVFITLIVMFSRQSNDRTNDDPQAIKNILNQLESDYEVVTNVMVPGDRGMFDLGHVVVSPYGVFVITVKQTIGKIFGRKGDREWEVKSGGSRDFIANPLWENRKHVNALEKLIGPAPFISIVVFPRGNLKGEFGRNVIRLGELKNFIAQNKTFNMSMDKRDGILKTLQKSQSKVMG